MRYDVFPFFNELDLAELRFKELEDVVDYWVVSEFTETHSGLRKALFFQDYNGRFRRWKDRIIHHVGTFHVDTPDPKMREREQRNAVKAILQPNPDDIITYTDCDEIPHPSAYQRFKPERCVAALDMAGFCYYLNGRRYIRKRYPKICTGATWTGALPYNLRFDNFQSDMTEWYCPYTVSPGGWHFTWLGTRRNRIKKAMSYCHAKDKQTSRLLKDLQHNELSDEFQITVVSIDKRWPRTVLNNREHYRSLGWIADVPTKS